MSETIDDLVKDGFSVMYTANAEHMAIYKKGQVRAMVNMLNKKVVTHYATNYKNEKDEMKAYTMLYGDKK
jgi:hypothetical protein